MLDAAAAFFAEHGLEAPTRDVAKALGVTQALIYKHFDSKDDLIERTLERAFDAGPDGDSWVDPDAALRDELIRFYTGMTDRANEQRMRLFIRAGLDGRSWPTRRGHTLTRRLFLPVIAALRHRAGLQGLTRLPPMRGERELAMMLHASVVFLGIRRHIYGMKLPADLSDVVTLYVDTFLEGAERSLRALHAGGDDSLTVPLATPRD